jgi:hypothetical protein
MRVVQQYQLLDTIQEPLVAAGINLGLPGGILHPEASCLLTKAWYFAPGASNGGGKLGQFQDLKHSCVFNKSLGCRRCHGKSGEQSRARSVHACIEITHAC